MAVLVLPAASVCVTSRVQVPSPLSIGLNPPSAHPGLEVPPPDAVRVQVHVPPDSPVRVNVGVVSLDGPVGPSTPGADGATVSSTCESLPAALVLPAASVCVALTV